jgi:hypothetical protein
MISWLLQRQICQVSNKLLLPLQILPSPQFFFFLLLLH